MSQENFVAIVDDDDVLREMLGEMLKCLHLSVVEYPDGLTFLQDPKRRRCACLVLDVSMPHMSGIEVQKRLKQEGAQIPIIFITAHGEVSMVVEAMRDGASDFLLKPVHAQELVDSVQSCLRDAEARRRANRDEDVFVARLACLTVREREVFDQIAAGRRSKQIAGILGVSLKTVEDYRSKVLHKMHVSSTPELLSTISQLMRPQSILSSGSKD